MNPVPQPGFEALLQGLIQGGQPVGQTAKNLSPILGGLASQGSSIDQLTPDMLANLSSLLRNQVGGEGARAPAGVGLQ